MYVSSLISVQNVRSWQLKLALTQTLPLLEPPARDSPSSHLNSSFCSPFNSPSPRRSHSSCIHPAHPPLKPGPKIGVSGSWRATFSRFPLPAESAPYFSSHGVQNRDPSVSQPAGCRILSHTPSPSAAVSPASLTTFPRLSRPQPSLRRPCGIPWGKKTPG